MVDLPHCTFCYADWPHQLIIELREDCGIFTENVGGGLLLLVGEWRENVPGFSHME
jgi:hypothetical protein